MKTRTTILLAVPLLLLSLSLGRAELVMKTLRLVALAAALLATITPQLSAQSADELSEQVVQLHRQGKYEEGIPIAKKVVELRKVHEKEEPAKFATSLNNLALLYQCMGDYGNAEPLYQRALAICEKVLGHEHPATATSLINLAVLYNKKGDYGKAEPFFKRALAVNEKVLGPEHPDTACALNNLATLYNSMGDFAKAEPLYQRTLAICEKVLGPEHPNTASSLNSLASLYNSTGDFAKAEPLYQRALVIREKVLGPKHPDTASSLNSLAEFYRIMGDCGKAEPLYQRALSIREKVLGPEHPYTAISLNNLAALYQTIGDYGKAQPLYERALAICEKVLGPEHPYTATSINNLASLYQLAGEEDKAAPLLLKAVEIRRKIFGKEHLDYATSINNLAVCYSRRGNYIKADPLLLQVVDIRRKLLGRMHPDYAQALYGLAANQLDLNRPTDALAYGLEAESICRNLWGRLLSFTSESQREAAIRTVGSLNLCGTLSDGPLAARSLLWRKGALLDSLVEERRLARAAGADKKLAGQFAEAENLKGILRQALMEGNKVKLSETQIAKYQTQLEALQKAMALKIGGLGDARRSLECSVEQVQAAIPKGAVLVDCMRYDHALGKNKSDGRYAAVLVMPSVDPVFVALGNAEKIDAALARHRKLAGNSSAAGDAAAAAARDAALEAACKELYALIGVPVEAALPPGTTELILCPDGQLHFLAFTSLMDKGGKLWAEKFTLRNISTARDLLKLPRSHAAGSDKTVVLVGNPDFRDSTPLALMAEAEDARDKDARQRLAFNLTRGGQNGELRGLNFRALQGTAVEVAGLKNRFDKQGWTTKTLTGPEASEVAVVAAVNGPDILHLATHGFFVDELDLGQKKAGKRQAMNGGMGDDDLRQRSVARDPMLRSGLALSGAQSTRSLWENGKVPPLDKDGILTAAEVASLRLQGTRLVTLSACETGLGESKSGEGVLGLQRAIALAGAENLLMTLWNINDADTIALMASFYDRVLAGEHPARALPAAQREALIRLRAGHGIWYAVNRAAPFVIVSNTAVPAASKN